MLYLTVFDRGFHQLIHDCVPDQRAMENGEYDLAATEKNRVEEKQRARRRVREQKGEEFIPRWFRKGTHRITGEEYWVAKGSAEDMDERPTSNNGKGIEYWQHREGKDWKGLRRHFLSDANSVKEAKCSK